MKYTLIIRIFIVRLIDGVVRLMCFINKSVMVFFRIGMNLYNGISDTSGSLESNSAFNTIVISIACFFMVFGVGSLYYMYRTKTLVN